MVEDQQRTAFQRQPFPMICTYCLRETQQEMNCGMKTKHFLESHTTKCRLKGSPPSPTDAHICLPHHYHNCQFNFFLLHTSIIILQSTNSLPTHRLKTCNGSISSSLSVYPTVHFPPVLPPIKNRCSSDAAHCISTGGVNWHPVFRNFFVIHIVTLILSPGEFRWIEDVSIPPLNSLRALEDALPTV